MGNFIRIDGDIKQKFLPFMPIPGSDMSKFSYNAKNASASLPLGIYPQSMARAFDMDVSNKLLYSRDNNTGEMIAKCITLDNVMESIPSIQIREYLPNAALDQLICMFTDIFKIVSKGKEQKDKNGKVVKAAESDDTFFGKVKLVCKYVFKYLVGSTYPNLWSETTLESVQEALSNWKERDDNFKAYIMKFPYIMYYRMLSCTTTNLYELPCVVKDQLLYNSDGTGGWNASEFRLGEMGPLKMLSMMPVIGSYVKSFTDSIAISYQRPWDPSAHGGQEPEIVVNVNLFNDTLEHAMANFIFVNTIVPNNRWLQYNIFQHSSNLYDIKIEGISRLYMCSAKFDVKSKGVLRDPSAAFFKELKKHLNTCMDAGSFIDSTLKKKLIKIPDMYQVEMHFYSVLPSNFNTFLFNYANSHNIIDDVKDTYTSNVVSKFIGNAINNIANHVANVWELGKDSVEAKGMVKSDNESQSVDDKKRTLRMQLKSLENQKSIAISQIQDYNSSLKPINEQKDELDMMLYEYGYNEEFMQEYDSQMAKLDAEAKLYEDKIKVQENKLKSIEQQIAAKQKEIGAL